MVVRLVGRDPMLAKMLLEMSQSITNADSLKLGCGMVAELKPVGRMIGAVEHAGFAVLRAPDIPSILIETAFISNPEESATGPNANHQLKLALAIRSGVREFLAARSRRGLYLSHCC